MGRMSTEAIVNGIVNFENGRDRLEAARETLAAAALLGERGQIEADKILAGLIGKMYGIPVTKSDHGNAILSGMVFPKDHNEYPAAQSFQKRCRRWITGEAQKAHAAFKAMKEKSNARKAQMAAMDKDTRKAAREQERCVALKAQFDNLGKRFEKMGAAERRTLKECAKYLLTLK